MAKAKSSSTASMPKNSENPFQLQSFYGKIVGQENAAVDKVYPAECNAALSAVPSDMQGATRNVQTGP